jgi:hypothetical protein
MQPEQLLRGNLQNDRAYLLKWPFLAEFANLTGSEKKLPYHLSTVAAFVMPAPTAVNSNRLPGLISPRVTAAASATGMDAAELFA